MLSDYLFFFFKQNTAYEMRISDWSSDVCSSDLAGGGVRNHRERPPVQSLLRREHHDQQQHEGQAGLERARQAAAVVATLGGRVERRFGRVQVHGLRMAADCDDARASRKSVV